MYAYIVARCKGGLGPLIIIGFVTLALLYILGMSVSVNDLSKPLLESFPLYVSAVPVLKFAILLLTNAFLLLVVTFMLGVAKHHGFLGWLVSWMPPKNPITIFLYNVFGVKEEKEFIYIVKGLTAEGPATGLVTNEFIDTIDGRKKFSVFYPTSPNPITGPPITDIDEKQFLTKEQFEKHGFGSVDDALRMGFVIIYSDLRRTDNNYKFADFLTRIMSFGRYAPTGKQVKN